MQINYQCSFFLFYQFELANRHFQVAFSNESTIQRLWDNKVIEHTSGEPLSILDRVKHFVLGAGLYLPLIGLVIALADRYFQNRPIFCVTLNPKIKQALTETPTFNRYGFDHSSGAHLTGLDVRPCDLFFRALLGKEATTAAGSAPFFNFKKSHEEIRQAILNKSDDEIIEFSARGQTAKLYQRNSEGLNCKGEKNLEEFLGQNIYRISVKEIKEMLESQHIYVSPLIPKTFYLEVEKALQQDHVDALPATDYDVPTLGEIAAKVYPQPSDSLLDIFLGVNTPSKNSLYHLSNLLKKVAQNPKEYGFVDNRTMLSFDLLKSLTLYQLGSMIVKTENYHSFVGKGYRLLERNANSQDAITLVSASGIRGFHQTKSIEGNAKHQLDRLIMFHTFQAAFKAAGEGGYAIFPALGMGIWGGDPNIYWKAFLDAVVETDTDLENIFVNPGHQTTPYGKFIDYSGEEFAEILEKYKRSNPSNPNLKKVINLFDHKTDLLLFATNLKKAYPEKKVALVNASDPDCTLGGIVGEYFMNLCHPPTTEENFACAGTIGLGFKGITKVLENNSRVTQLA